MTGPPDPRPARTRKPKRVGEAERDAREGFKRVVLALDRACLMHPGGDGCDGPLAAHHVVSQQQLRAAGLRDLLWTPAAGMALCERAHRRHHNRAEPVPRSLVPARCLRLAADHGLERVLERYYPSP